MATNYKSGAVQSSVAEYIAPQIPDPRYSMSYSERVTPAPRRFPGQKIIVCAVLMGRRYTCLGDKFHDFNSAMAEFDSHMPPSQYEYIVFKSAQLLPLYVLHVTDGTLNLESVGTAEFNKAHLLS
jgi:hypothetical protein